MQKQYTDFDGICPGNWKNNRTMHKKGKGERRNR